MPSNPTSFPSPLAIPNPDVVLRSSDGVDFRTLKALLTLSSSVFEGMFSLPRPANRRVDVLEGGLPVVPLEETADMVDILLRFCVPQPPPNFESVTQAARVLEGARKYEMRWAQEAISDTLRRFSETEPVRVYAIACRYGFEVEARDAALHCLQLPLSTIIHSDIEEVNDISSGQLRRLLKYRERCRDAVAKKISSAALLPKPFSTIPYGAVWKILCCSKHGERLTDGNREWYCKYIEKVVEDLKECTWPGSVKTEDAMAAFIRSVPCVKCCAKAPEDLSKLRNAITLTVVAEISDVGVLLIL